MDDYRAELTKIRAEHGDHEIDDAASQDLNEESDNNDETHEVTGISLSLFNNNSFRAPCSAFAKTFISESFRQFRS
jgi:hypothetical protein